MSTSFVSQRLVDLYSDVTGLEQLVEESQQAAIAYKHQYRNAQSVIVERDQTIAECCQEIAERDRCIHQLNNQHSEDNNRLEAIQQQLEALRSENLTHCQQYQDVIAQREQAITDRNHVIAEVEGQNRELQIELEESNRMRDCIRQELERLRSDLFQVIGHVRRRSISTTAVSDSSSSDPKTPEAVHQEPENVASTSQQSHHKSSDTPFERKEREVTPFNFDFDVQVLEEGEIEDTSSQSDPLNLAQRYESESSETQSEEEVAALFDDDEDNVSEYSNTSSSSCDRASSPWTTYSEDPVDRFGIERPKVHFASYETLKRRLGWSNEDFDVLKVFVGATCKKHLDTSQTYCNQTPRRMSKVVTQALQRFPELQIYAKGWPIYDMIELRLKTTSAAERKIKNHELEKQSPGISKQGRKSVTGKN